MVGIDALDVQEVELATCVDKEELVDEARIVVEVVVGGGVVVGVEDVLSVIVTVTVLVLVGSGCTIEIAVVASTVVVVAVDTISVIVIVCTTVSVAVAVDVVVPLALTLTTEYVALLRSMTGVCCSVSAIGNASVWYGRVIAVERKKSVVGKCMIEELGGVPTRDLSRLEVSPGVRSRFSCESSNRQIS
jgi:hypothetical protein